MKMSNWTIGLLILLASSVPAWSQTRVALLLGNGSYEAPGLALANPANDISAVASVLARQGFDVAALVDQSRDDMLKAVEEFVLKAEGAELALFFYAGHGVQLGGDNYLIGVEFEGSDAEGLQQASIRLSDVRERLSQAGSDLAVLVIDACRDTPFSERGLARPGLRRESGGLGQLIAYATDPGNVALDGVGENSVFTSALLDHIETPGLDVRLMFGRVRQQVVLDSGGRQVPWVEEAVVGEHVISAEPPPAMAAADPLAEEIGLWRQAGAQGLDAGYRDYLMRYPNGVFADIASERIGAVDGNSATDVGTDTTIDLAAADPKALGAALATLGLMRAAGDSPPSLEVLSRSFESYRQRQRDPQAVGPNELYREAGRYSAFLAAATAQRLRTDIVALRSVERTLDIAEDALAKIEQIARGDAAALPVLAQARSDVAAIREARSAILRRLDLTRGYYEDLLEAAAAFMPPGATIDLLGGTGDARSTASPVRATFDDASLFLDHVARAQENQDGSYQWLSTFLPEE